MTCHSITTLLIHDGLKNWNEDANSYPAHYRAVCGRNSGNHKLEKHICCILVIILFTYIHEIQSGGYLEKLACSIHVVKDNYECFLDNYECFHTCVSWSL